MPENIAKIILSNSRSKGFITSDGVFVVFDFAPSPTFWKDQLQQYLKIRGSRPVIPFGPRGGMSKHQAEWAEKNWEPEDY